jgi:hypothetical protein
MKKLVMGYPAWAVQGRQWAKGVETLPPIAYRISPIAAFIGENL